VPLAGGRDGAAPTLEDYNGRDNRPGSRSGLGALAGVDEISILCAPDDQSVDGLSAAVVEQCERLADRFAIVNARAEDCFDVGKLEPAHSVGGRALRIDSKYAAFYAPPIRIIDATTGRVRRVPPGGHVAGVYARSDIERGVWKAPANEVLRGTVGLDPDYSTADQEILNPRGVNLIRALPGRGIRVWGARTTSSDPLWRYVNVRRLFLYIEESIDQGTQWVVFEPNDQRLWARVRQTVSDFLTATWRSGALMGTTAEEAFFVKCDETTMTQNDLMTGKLIVLIGVAPVRPAEFVIFRIAQWTRGAGDTA
jgi:phage tail sheath protein FI